MSAYMECPTCGGSGLVLGNAGEPDDCYECHGDCYVRARDWRGRFCTSSAQKQPTPTDTNVNETAANGA